MLTKFVVIVPRATSSAPETPRCSASTMAPGSSAQGRPSRQRAQGHEPEAGEGQAQEDARARPLRAEAV